MIDPVAFYIGSIGIRWYAIIIGSALLFGIFIIQREAKRRGIDQEFFLDFFLYGIPAAVIGARLYYVIFQWEIYSRNPAKILAFREGGLAIHGAVLGGLIVLIIMSKIRNISFWKSVDIISPALILGQAVGRWGNFINQEAHGDIVSKEFISHFPEFIQKQMFINGNYYHPTFLYESVWNIFIFIILIYFRKKDYMLKGDIFLLYIIGYSIGRFFIEAMRTDSLMLGSIRVAQLVSVTAIITGIIILYIRHRRESGNA
ncbi:MAG: prolipoprotein diacylglyceryl transferase [Halothermotrichaceae bacterium]